VVAIECSQVWKSYRRYGERNQTLKQAVIRRKRAVFEQLWAVQDLSFEVLEGETFGLIGGNGAGKSTTMKLLAGILVPDNGSIRLRGRVSALLELGAGFHPELTGRENVFLNGSILGIDRKTLEGKLDEIVEFAGLRSAIDRPIKTYSSGMYARLGFSVAVNVEPEILLLDEVLAVGDEAFQRKSAERIEQLRGQGRTVVLVSHGMASVKKMCGRAAWLDNGKIVSIGLASDVVDEYVSSVFPSARIDEFGRTRTGAGGVRVELHDGQPILSQEKFELTFRIEILDGPISASECEFKFFLYDDGDMLMQSNPIGLGTTEPGTTRQVTFSVNSLPLRPGEYDLGVQVVDASKAVVLDQCDRLARLILQSDRNRVHSQPRTCIGSWSSDD
jgi:ABC-type polysaccharide/polyol phosphate transport system ATPase subunit